MCFFLYASILQPGRGGSISSLLMPSKQPWAQPNPMRAGPFLVGVLAQGHWCVTHPSLVGPTTPPVGLGKPAPPHPVVRKVMLMGDASEGLI